MPDKLSAAVEPLIVMGALLALSAIAPSLPQSPRKVAEPWTLERVQTLWAALERAEARSRKSDEAAVEAARAPAFSTARGLFDTAAVDLCRGNTAAANAGFDTVGRVLCAVGVDLTAPVPRKDEAGRRELEDERATLVQVLGRLDARIERLNRQLDTPAGERPYNRRVILQDRAKLERERDAKRAELQKIDARLR